MSEELLQVLKLCLMALLYLFFFRVLRAVWVEVRAPAGASGANATRDRRPKTKRARPIAAPQLHVVEPTELAGTAYALGDELTVGRAAGCQITLDDTYASQLHARVFNRGGELYVEDLGSTNGTYLNRRKVAGPMAMKRGDRVQIGSTVLELQ